MGILGQKYKGVTLKNHLKKISKKAKKIFNL